MANLAPHIKISLNVNSSAQISSGANLVLMGFVSNTNNLNPGVEINTPIDLGPITSVSSVVEKLKSLGIQVTMTGLTSYDVDTTDEIAAMCIQAVATFQGWQPYMSANYLRTPRFIISILDETVNAKVTEPGFTPYGNTLLDIIEQEIEVTTIVPSYTFEAGDELLTGSYITELKDFVELQLAKANPNLGFLCPIFHSNFSKDTNFSVLGMINIMRSANFNAYQDVGSSEYQIPSSAIGAACGLVFCSLPFNAEGLVFQNIPSIPKALDLGFFSDDNIEAMLDVGLSPIVYKKNIQEQQFSRVVTSTLLDPNLGVTRSNMIDLQDFKAVYELQNRIYNLILSSKEIINKRTIINNGTPSTVNAINTLSIGQLVRAGQEGIILEPPSGFANSVKSYINPDNLSQIILQIKVYPASILYQVDGVIDVEDSSFIFSEFIINIA